MRHWATVIKFIVSQAIFCLIGMRTSTIYYTFLLINDLCTNTYDTDKKRMFTRLRTPGNSNKATVRKFIGGGTLDSGLYQTKSCNAPINVMPHLPQVGPGWRHIGVLHQLISKVLTLGATF